MALSIEQKDMVSKLATAYAAYCRAMENGDWNGVSVWGNMLVEAQESLGVEMFANHTVRSNIKYANMLVRIAAGEAA